MSANQALAAVRQIAKACEGPRNETILECIGQLVGSLLPLIDHPDSRVRGLAGRTLVKLARGYREGLGDLDLSKARAALDRCYAAAEDGMGDEDNEDMIELLEEFFGEKRRDPKAVAAAVAPASAKPSRPAERGEVVLKVFEEWDAKQKVAILDRVVKIGGVISVTFEGQFVIVKTRGAAVAADAGFLADLLFAIRAEGLQGVSLVSAAAEAGPSAALEERAPKEEEPEVKEPEPLGASPDEGEDEDEGKDEPGTLSYLDEDEAEDKYRQSFDDRPEQEGASSSSRAGPSRGGQGPGSSGDPQVHWSFFSQVNWMDARRMQEHGDDPTIAARLAKAKKKEEERKKEDKTRIGRLASWFTGNGNG